MRTKTTLTQNLAVRGDVDLNRMRRPGVGDGPYLSEHYRPGQQIMLRDSFDTYIACKAPLLRIAHKFVRSRRRLSSATKLFGTGPMPALDTYATPRARPRRSQVRVGHECAHVGRTKSHKEVPMRVRVCFSAQKETSCCRLRISSPEAICRGRS